MALRVGLATDDETAVLLKRLLKKTGATVVWRCGKADELARLCQKPSKAVDLIFSTLPHGEAEEALRQGWGPGTVKLSLAELTGVLTAREAPEARPGDEELLKKERLNGIRQMAERIAHDLRNPLTTIIGFAELLCQEEISAQDRGEYLTLIKGATARFTSLLDEVSSFVQREGRALKLERIRLDHLLKGSLEPFMGEIAARNITLEFEVADVEVRGDPEQLGQAISNIVRNSVEALPDGGALSLTGSKGPKGVEIEVRDTGKGIDPSIASRVFEPLVTKGKSGRLGLGLSIAKGIVEAHGGTIDVKETSCGGTTLVVVLPG